jgi:hypothetical protein
MKENIYIFVVGFIIFCIGFFVGIFFAIPSAGGPLPSGEEKPRIISKYELWNNGNCIKCGGKYYFISKKRKSVHTDILYYACEECGYQISWQD